MHIRHGIGALRATCTPLATYTPIPTKTLGTRWAHAAALEDHPHPHPADATAAAGPSRRPRRAKMEDYVFPETGAKGGPPTPFEILGLERSASGGQIKAACE